MTLDDRCSAEERKTLEARAVGYFRGAIGGDGARYLPPAKADRDLDPLRNRADFRAMMADAGSPHDPLAWPSPIGVSSATSGERKIRGEALIAGGRTLDAIP